MLSKLVPCFCRVQVVNGFEVGRVQVTTADGSTVWLTVLRVAIGSLGGGISYYIAKELFEQLAIAGAWHPRRVSNLSGVRTSTTEETQALRAGKKIAASSPSVTLIPTAAAKAWLHDSKQDIVADQLTDDPTPTGNANTGSIDTSLQQHQSCTGLVGAGCSPPALQKDWQHASRYISMQGMLVHFDLHTTKHCAASLTAG